MIFRKNVDFLSKTGGFESYDSHQLLCTWKVEVKSEPFRIATFARRSFVRIPLKPPEFFSCYNWRQFSFNCLDKCEDHFPLSSKDFSACNFAK